MMNKNSYLLVLMLVVIQAGCSLGQPTRPSEFYVLNAEAGVPVSGRQASPSPLSLGLGPVSIPDVFDRPQIVTRPATNQINLAEYDRWGGDLKGNLDLVLAENLMSRLNTDSVVLHPWSSRNEPDYQVAIRFFRFDGELGKVARIEGVWRLLDGKQGCELASHSFKYEEQPAGPEYRDFVSAMSGGVARLTQDIAERVAMTAPGCKTSE